MSKNKNYFDAKMWSVGRQAEAKKRSNATFFSSKEDSTEFFDNSAGSELTVVGVAPIAEDKKRGMPAYNVVLFDDGHQLSTSRFFTAKGLKWPVGGNTAKWDYLCACLANGTKVTVEPEKVEVGEERTIADGDRAGEKFTPVTYFFAEKSLPVTDMSILQQGEKGDDE